MFPIELVTLNFIITTIWFAYAGSKMALEIEQLKEQLKEEE